MSQDLIVDAVAPGGWIIVAGFAPNGPERCSGLPIRRHSRTSRAEALAPAFLPEAFVEERHATPSNAEQPFLIGVFHRC